MRETRETREPTLPSPSNAQDPRPRRGQPRICPGCRTLDGEHTFNPENCTLAGAFGGA